MNAARPSRAHAWLVAAALVLATFLAYGRLAHAGFLRFDDGEYVVDNPAVRGGLSAQGLRFAFGAFHSSNWHPLTWLSHMLDVELFGLDAGAHHLVNVALHATTALVLLAFFLRTTGSLARSALVAGLFALHPLRVQSVAWVSERKDLLAGLLFALLLCAWARYAARPTRARYALALALHALGLLAKPMLVSAPFVLLLVDRWPLARDARLGRRVLEKLPFLALALASAAVTLRAQRAGGALSFEIPLAARLANAATSVWTYVGHELWPVGLAYFHPHPALVDPLWRAARPATFVALAALVLAGALALRLRRSRPAVAAGAGWMLVMLLPVLGLVQVGEQAWAERYAYLPLVGLEAALVFGLDVPAAARRAVGAALVLLLALCGVLTWRASGPWLDSRALYEHALGTTERNYMAHTGLANVLRDAEELEPARAEYERALAVRPTFPAALYGLGLLAQEAGEHARAIELYERALASAPGLVEAHLNLGACLGATGELDRAIEEFGRVLALDPGQPAARANLEQVRERFEPAVRAGSADAATRRRYERARELLGPRGETVSVDRTGGL